MINNLMYIELKTGYSDDVPAWIGYVKTSKSKKTIYFNDHAFQKNIGNYANYIDIENGDKYWISGLKKEESKAEKENKDLKAEIEDLKKTVEKRGATISELNTELCNARAEAKANEVPEELIQEMYCMAYDKEAESIGKMERAADQMTEATIAGEDAHGFAEEYKKQKENRNRSD